VSTLAGQVWHGGTASTGLVALARRTSAGSAPGSIIAAKNGRHGCSVGRQLMAGTGSAGKAVHGLGFGYFDLLPCGDSGSG
jgi:hypothetical protein